MKTMLKGLVFTNEEKFYEKLCLEFENKVSVFRESNFLDALVISATINPDFMLIDCDAIKSHEKILQRVLASDNMKNMLIILVTDSPLNLDINLNCEDIIVLSKSNFELDLIEVETLIQMKKIKVNKYYLQDNEVDTQLSKKLDELGFNTKYIGTIYLKELIKIILYNEGEISFLNSKLYPILAFRYQTKVENIERNIRNAIKHSYIVSGEKKFETVLKMKKFEKKYLANRSFIALFIERFRSEFSVNKEEKQIV